MLIQNLIRNVTDRNVTDACSFYSRITDPAFFYGTWYA